MKMTKIIAVSLLCLLLIPSLALIALADNPVFDTEVEVTYELTIPESSTFDYGQTTVELGTVGISNLAHFGIGDRLVVDIQCTALASDRSMIHYNLAQAGGIVDGVGYDIETGYDQEADTQVPRGVLTFIPSDAAYNDMSQTIAISISEEEWNAAPAGVYSMQMIFEVEYYMAEAEEP